MTFVLSKAKGLLYTNAPYRVSQESFNILGGHISAKYNSKVKILKLLADFYFTLYSKKYYSYYYNTCI